MQKYRESGPSVCCKGQRRSQPFWGAWYFQAAACALQYLHEVFVDILPTPVPSASFHARTLPDSDVSKDNIVLLEVGAFVKQGKKGKCPECPSTFTNGTIGTLFTVLSEVQLKIWVGISTYYPKTICQA